MMLLQLQGKQFIHKLEAPFFSAVETTEGVVLFLLLGEQSDLELEVSLHTAAATAE